MSEKVWEKILRVTQREGPNLRAIYMHPDTARHLRGEFESAQYYAARASEEQGGMESDKRCPHPGYFGTAMGVDYIESDFVPVGELEYVTVKNEGSFTLGVYHRV